LYLFQSWLNSADDAQSSTEATVAKLEIFVAVVSILYLNLPHFSPRMDFMVFVVIDLSMRLWPNFVIRAD